MDRKTTTPVPAAVQAKMQAGVRQRYAAGTTQSVNPKGNGSKAK